MCISVMNEIECNQVYKRSQCPSHDPPISAALASRSRDLLPSHISPRPASTVHFLLLSKPEHFLN